MTPTAANPRPLYVSGRLQVGRKVRWREGQREATGVLCEIRWSGGVPVMALARRSRSDALVELHFEERP